MVLLLCAQGVPVIISRSTATEERPYQLAFSSISKSLTPPCSSTCDY